MILFAGGWSFFSISLLVLFVLFSVYVIFRHQGCYKIDGSAIFMMVLYLIRFVFIAIFQFNIYGKIISDVTLMSKFDLFVVLMLTISPTLLNLAYFFYVYEMIHVKVLLEAPNHEEAAKGKKKANRGRILTMLSKLLLLVGVLGVGLSGDFQNTNAGIALQYTVKLFIIALQIYVCFVFFNIFLFMTMKKKEMYKTQKLSLRNLLTITWVCTIATLFHANLFSYEIL